MSTTADALKDKDDKEKTVTTMSVWEVPLMAVQLFVMVGCWYLVYLSMMQGRDFMTSVTPEGTLRLRLQVGIMIMIAISYFCMMLATIAVQSGRWWLAIIPALVIIVVEPVSIVTSFWQYSNIRAEDIQNEKDNSKGFTMRAEIARMQTKIAEGLGGTSTGAPDDHITVATKAGEAGNRVLESARQTMDAAEAAATSSSENTNSKLAEKFGIDPDTMNWGFAFIQTFLPLSMAMFFTLLIGKRMVKIKSAGAVTVGGAAGNGGSEPKKKWGFFK